MERATQGTAQRGMYGIGGRQPSCFLGSLSDEAREELLSIGSRGSIRPARRSLWKGRRAIA